MYPSAPRVNARVLSPPLSPRLYQGEALRGVEAIRTAGGDSVMSTMNGYMAGKVLPSNYAEMRRASFSRASSPGAVQRISSPTIVRPPSPRRQTSYSSLLPEAQLICNIPGALLPPQAYGQQQGYAQQVVRQGSYTTLQPQHGFQAPQVAAPQALQNYGVQNMQQPLEQQLSECRSMLSQTQERNAAIVQERDQRLSMQECLVDDLRQAIDSQRREAEELRRQQSELVFTNQEQARRLADLENLLQEMHREPPRNQRPNARQMPQRGQAAHERGASRERLHDSPGDLAAQSLALQPLEHQHHLLGGDAIDLSLQEFFDMHPDFDIALAKHKPGWYTFDKPINKKVYMKIVGDNVIVRAGGGHVELHKWLAQYHHRAQGKRDA